MTTPSTRRTKALTNEDLPDFAMQADLTALRAERKHFLATRLQLLLVIAAAGFARLSIGSSGDVEIAKIIAAVMFVLAAVVRGSMAGARQDDIWYGARAAAESAKSLTWRYAVGGDPFRVDQVPREEAGSLFISRLGELAQTLRGFPVVPTRDAQQITPAMEALRSATLDRRSAEYVQARLVDQCNWYSSKAAWNHARARLWNATTLFFELAGAVFAVLVGTGLVGFEVASLTASVIGAATAWTNARQHRSLAIAYSLAATELASLRSLSPPLDSEEAWASYVERVEQAISREHTVWISSKKR